MNKRSWLIAFLTTVIFILVKGYTFNGGDQEEHLPPVYQLIDSSLYPKDYFVTACHQTFTVRFFFVWLIYLFHFILPVSLTCFLLHLMCVTIVAWCIQQIALHFNATNMFASCSAFFALVTFNSFSIGGNALMDTQLTCGGLAAAFCALAFYYMLKNRWYVVALMAGLASIFQVLAGLQVMLILALLYIVIEKKKDKIATLIKVLALFILVASPMLLPIMYLQMQSQPTDQSQMFYDILYRVRNPNHYLPSTFPVQDYVRFASLTIAAGILHFFVDDKLKQLWRTLFLIVIGGMVVYTFLLEGINFMPIGKLQWFKASEWMQLMDVIVIIVFTSGFPSARFAMINRLKIPTPYIIVCIVAGMIIITKSNYLPSDRLKYRYQIGNYPKTDLSKMHEWIRLNTPVDCVILSSPDDPSFLCEAQRSMPIGWKAIIHEPFFLIPWYDKFISAYHNDEPFNGFNVLEQASDHYNKIPPGPSPKLNWDYRLVNLVLGDKRLSNEVLIHSEGSIALFKITGK